MSRRRRKPTQQKRRAWQPMVEGMINPRHVSASRAAGEDVDNIAFGAWANDVYQVVVRAYSLEHETWPGVSYLSIHRHDRHAVHDWRHLQQIKNEVVGPEREAVEIYPAESRLTDEANEYHLWVLPEGAMVPFGSTQRQVSTDEELAAFNKGRERGEHKGRQRAWQPGLTTGREGPS